jgi:hypothetical protein
MRWSSSARRSGSERDRLAPKRGYIWVRRGAGADERDGLENRWPLRGGPWVRIPPPPPDRAESRHRSGIRRLSRGALLVRRCPRKSTACGADWRKTGARSRRPRRERSWSRGNRHGYEQRCRTRRRRCGRRRGSRFRTKHPQIGCFRGSTGSNRGRPRLTNFDPIRRGLGRVAGSPQRLTRAGAWPQSCAVPQL